MIFFLRKYKRYFRAILFWLAVFVLGGLVGFWFSEREVDNSCQKDFEFINSDIVCGKPAVINKASYTVLRTDILSFIEAQKELENVSDVALYFRDLKNGPVFGVDELREFSPASLLKLPLSIVFFDIEEEEEGFLKKKVLYKEIETPLTQTFVPAVTPKENHPYSLETLLFNTLVYSDNVSYQILLEYLNKTSGGSARILRTFQNLGIVDPRSDVENTLTVRGYASLFRLLYNVSYLNSDNSEKILSWLSKSDFILGLVAGVPEDVSVAHKFGERDISGTVSIKQLHDCGIVYYPDNPYLLCVMTRGKDMKVLAGVIQTISSMVYKEVNSRRL